MPGKYVAVFFSGKSAADRTVLAQANAFELRERDIGIELECNGVIAADSEFAVKVRYRKPCAQWVLFSMVFFCVLYWAFPFSKSLSWSN